MSWVSSWIDKARKAAGLPVISINNAGAIAKKAVHVVAPFVPGGTYIDQGIDRFGQENEGKSGGDVARETWDNVTSAAGAAVEGARTAAQVEASVDSVLRSPTTVLLLGVLVVVLLFTRKR